MPGELPEVRVEFFGTARLRAGIADMVVPVGPVRELLREIEMRLPRLTLLTPEGKLQPHYLVSMNGSRFLTVLDEVVQVEDVLLILGADSGG